MALTQNEKIVVGVLVGGSVVVGSLFMLANIAMARAVERAVEDLPAPTPAPDQNGHGAQALPAVDLEAVMPPSADFPMGWRVEGEGVREGRDFRLGWRLLSLNAPSDKCSPQPCTYVLVISAQNVDGKKSTQGWGGFINHERAWAELESLTHQYGQAA